MKLFVESEEFRSLSCGFALDEGIIIIIIIIITDECYLGGTVALLLQDHLTMLI